MLNLIVNLKEFFSKKVLISIAIVSIFWLLILLVIVHVFQKKITTEKLKIENKDLTINGSNCNYDKSSEKIKIFDKNSTYLYAGDPISQYKTSLYLKKENDDKFNTLIWNIDFYNDGMSTYDTEIPNIILYSSSFGDMGAWNFTDFYINTDTKKTIKIEGGNGYLIDIYDEINDYKNSTIQVSINDQCENENIKKAWVKDINVNGYPQGIFSKEYEIRCIGPGELGDLAYLDNVNINKNLDKIFFSYNTYRPDGAEIEENYSYNLLTKKINIEKPNNVLKLGQGQHLDPEGKILIKD